MDGDIIEPMTKDRIEMYRKDNETALASEKLSSQERINHEVIKELLDALEYERRVCASQVKVIKRLRDDG